MTTTTTYVLDLPAATDHRTVGRKAATLAGLRGAGFSVPDGIVLIADALDHALTAAGLTAAASAEEVTRIELPGQIAKALRDAVGRWGGVPLAVRSSGVEEDLVSASYAGLYATVLDVAGEAELWDAVRLCWVSAFGELVRSYRAGGTGDSAGLAVLVQPMVRASAAGVAFTADPVTGEREVVVIEAVRGLGDRLVSGTASPETWVVRHGTASRRTAGVEDALDAETARSIAALARRVEEHFGGPQDVEWALSGEDVVLLQARPVTALPVRSVEPVPVPVEPPPGYWTREATHAPLPWTPFTRSVMRLRTPALARMCTELGLLFETIDLRDIGGLEYMRIVPLGGKDRPTPPRPLVPLLFRLVPPLRRRVRSCVAAMRADVCGRLVQRWYTEWQPDLARRIGDLRAVDLAELTDPGLDEHLAKVMDLLEHSVGVHMRLHGAVEITLAELAFTCRDLLGWNEARTFDLLCGLSATSTEPSRALAHLAALADECQAVRARLTRRAPVADVLAQDARFAAAFAEFLGTHGCRALRYEVAEQNLDERPDLVAGLVADQLAAGFDPGHTDAALTARREHAVQQARAALRQPQARARFERALTRAERAYPVREDNEYFTVSAVLALVRRTALEIGRRLADRGRLNDPGDVFWLETADARSALSDRASRRDVVTRAKGQRAWVLTRPGPASYGKDPGPPPSFHSLPAEARLANEGFLWTVEHIFGPEAVGPKEATNGEVTGIPASPGSYTGPVRVIGNESEFDRLRAGDVLVCPVTSPVWSVLFPSVGALVTDTGGILSHPAIIAREYGVPAVVATGSATSALRDGQIVTVDGTAGIVQVRP